MNNTKFFDYRNYCPPSPPNWDSSTDSIGADPYQGEYGSLNTAEAYDSFSDFVPGDEGLRGMESGLRGGMTASDSELLQQMSDQIDELKTQLAERQVPADSAADPQAGDQEVEVSENPLLLYLQQSGQTKLDEKQLQKVLRRHGLSEDALRSMSLPPDAETSQQLLDCFQELDPAFAKQLGSDPANPYRPEVIHALTGILGAALPESITGLSDETSIAILDQTTKVTWDANKIKGQLTGKTDYAEGAEINGRWVHCGKFVDEYLTKLANGSIGLPELTNYLAQGNNDYDHGGLNRAIEIRRSVSALYYVAEKNPYLLRRYLKLIPEPALRLMKDYLGMDPQRQDIGDQWDGKGTMDILNWAISGGPLPAGLAGPSDKTG